MCNYMLIKMEVLEKIFIILTNNSKLHFMTDAKIG